MPRLTKQELRKHFKALRLARDPEEKRSADRAVCNAFIESDVYKNSRDILIYVSGDMEIGTIDIIEKILGDINGGADKRLLCPRCVSETNEMHFYRINSLDDLETGHFGILEPATECQRIDDYTHALCVVPALSFDTKGYRLGFGKGFYDRFLTDFKGVTVGLCCESCLTKGELPRDEHDVSVDWIITEKGWIKIPADNIKERKSK
ncbi:5-formyltetrahydrofolate cyclo-ligase [Ruminococcus albus]|uniref:5-formyltetrahydrofolate cyclo-ligase n=1 Tax=Ruminococcus albus TaxID=1264 RepID=A0A1I1E6E4_RUMAL|nr:5-formyltetrahydrofolate cyclo-ligase [Ruminococcus albus]SFB80848.1 5-formyltetrahydrofolate cyclo-ligase [Ruminococcus albus]